MLNVKTIFLIAILALAAISCSSDDGENSSSGIAATIKKAKISGVSQKGPFVKGTRATLYEINDKFAQTGRSFFDIIADDKGTFEIKDVELASPYALLEADGFYRNEVTGKVSAAPIKLYAIADIREKDNININLLTHLEYYRVQALALAGKSIAEAKKQAQREILAVFGIDGDFINSEDMSIFGTTEGDAALLAISVLMQGDLSEGEFSQRLTDFAQSLKTSGTWNNKAEKEKIANWAAGANLEGIKQNILAWDLSSKLPDLEKIINAYLLDAIASNLIDAFIDERDGQAYKYVKIGDQIWMAKNLNYDAEGSKCYDNNIANCYKYGRLYDWATAMALDASCNSTCASQVNAKHRGVCPFEWHIPSNDDWTTLTDFVGGSSIAGTKLKATNDWNIVGGYKYGTDEFGFSALPGGICLSDGNFTFGYGDSGFWWIADYDRYANIEMRDKLETLNSYSGKNSGKSPLVSIRCLKD